eukprot:2432479-Rhodomonas_salina.2
MPVLTSDRIAPHATCQYEPAHSSVRNASLVPGITIADLCWHTLGQSRSPQIKYKKPHFWCKMY